MRHAFAVCFSLSVANFRADEPKSTPFAEIRVVDAATGRGVPLVELTTVNNVRFVTDNAGRVAFLEPGLMDRELYFTIKSHGYEVKKDGFGFRGAKIVPKAGQVAEIRITRLNIAERLCRLTGEGRYRDTQLLGYKPPLAGVAEQGLVVGQDSVQAEPYKGSIYWFWGDTSFAKYPLGMFRTAGAKSALPATGFDPAAGIPFDYFVDRAGFARAMIPYPAKPEGVIWIDGVCTVPDEKGVDKLVAHFSRRKGLQIELEHGIAIFDDEKGVFVPTMTLPLQEKWRFPHGHPILVEALGKKWLACGQCALNVRVPATLKDICKPERYEAFTCASSAEKGKPVDIEKDGDGVPSWRWQANLPPMGSREEADLFKAEKLNAEHLRFVPADVANPNERIRLHSGTVRWSGHLVRWSNERKRYVMLAGQIGGTSSHLGEVWFSEADHWTGPFIKAIKVATHDKMSFYNVCQHSFLTSQFLKNDNYLYVEGTYTHDFSGNPDKTPRYEYNQILYRLDLDSPALHLAGKGK